MVDKKNVNEYLEKDSRESDCGLTKFRKEVIMNQKVKSSLLLLLTAIIWGSSFVAQRTGIEYIGPFTMNSIRSFLGTLVLLPLIKVMDMQRRKSGEDISKTEEQKSQGRKDLILGGICCGLALTVASSLQQIGMLYTTAGKSGFITALYILIVPIIGIFLKKKVGMKTWLGVALAVIGMYFLSVKEGFSISKGDFLTFLCAIVFALHILIVDYFSPKVDGVKLSCIQFAVCGVLCACPMVLLERPTVAQILTAWLPIAYAGIMSCGVAYTLQIIAQKGIDPTVASLLMSLESVFAALSGWLILHEHLSARELFGCVLVFVAIILAQLPDKVSVSEKERKTVEE